MDGRLFKIDRIDGKGLGWIALRDIKAGTLIYEEKPQFVMKNKRINWRPDFLKLLKAPNTAKCYFKTDHNKKPKSVLDVKIGDTSDI